MRARPPLGDHPEPLALVGSEREQRLVDSDELRGASLDGDQQHPEHKRSDLQLAGSDTDRQQRLDPPGDGGGVDDPLEPLERLGRGHGAAPISATTAASSRAGRSLTRSPSRCEQLIPAARMNA